MKCFLITDRSVESLYGKAMLHLLQEEGVDIKMYAIPDGEMYKTRRMKEEIEDVLLSHGMGKDSLILALGGGVVLDLAGFVAATYCRGIPYISIPTTLMAMIDAGIGGKTGVNVAQAKNYIGAFHLPLSTFIYPPFLESLAEKEWRNGYAEMIKYGIIASKQLFEQLERGQFCEDMLYESIRIKTWVVEQDPYDRGLRRILNFGHTIGHAVEALSEYTICHGEAVALGIAIESYISMHIGGMPQGDYERIIDLLSYYGFSLELKIPCERLIEALSFDKKNVGASPRCVIIPSIGSTDACDGLFCRSVPRNVIEEAYHHVHAYSSK